MAARAAAHVESEAVIPASTEVLAEQLLAEVRRHIGGTIGDADDRPGVGRLTFPRAEALAALGGSMPAPRQAALLLGKRRGPDSGWTA